jgi:hypothetical protein
LKRTSKAEKLAIDELYAHHQIAVGADALAILRKNGVVGCLHDDSDLSEKYKEKLDWSSKSPLHS